jgi:2-hydroxy-3-oxopropionate reductase
MTKIAFIGLGIMGGPMSGHLAAAGHDVSGFDVSAEAVARLVAAGGIGASSVADATEGADVVITMLPNHPHVEDVVLGASGVLEVAKPGTLLIDMSTIRPETSLEVAKAGKDKGIRVLDAPVSGGEAGAKQAALSIMVGGEEEDFAAAKPRRPARRRPGGEGGEPAGRRRDLRARRRGHRVDGGLRRRRQDRPRRAGRRPRCQPDPRPQA